MATFLMEWVGEHPIPDRNRSKISAIGSLNIQLDAWTFSWSAHLQRLRIAMDEALTRRKPNEFKQRN
jgi:hypothetical protein